MNLRNDRRALADRGGNALRRSGTNIANRKNTGAVRFERSAAGTAYDKPIGIGGHAIACPAGIGVGTDEQEKMSQRVAAGLAVCRSAKRRRSEISGLIPFEARQFFAGMDFDIRESRDAVNQIARHSLRKIAPNEQAERTHKGREKYDRLSRRIAAADKGDVFACAQPRLDRRRPIGDTLSFESRQIGDVGPAILCARGDHDRPGVYTAIFRADQRQRT